jgi:polar amino acid transport system substrate-binding protein
MACRPLSSAGRRTMLKLLALAGTAFAGTALAVPRSAEAAGLTLADIKRSGVLKVGMALNPPMVLQGVGGGWYSFNPELCRRLGQSWGVKIDFIGATWETIIPGLLAHKYDMIGASISATALRKQVINFSDPYYEAGQVFVVNKNNPKHLTSIAALNRPSVTVAYTQSSIEGEITHKVLPNATDRALTSSSVGDLIAEIESGRSDAFAITSNLRQPIMARFPWAATVPDNDTGLNPTPVAWGLRKEDTGLLQAVNAFIDTAMQDGTVAALLKKDLTPTNAGLG